MVQVKRHKGRRRVEGTDKGGTLKDQQEQEAITTGG